MDDTIFKKLRWRCRRGMKELDVLMQGYLHEMYRDAPAEEQQAFQALVEMPDPELYHCFIGKQTLENPQLAALIEKIRKKFNLV
ncbi:MAG: succinate dehydrogenase assembly factor 2 [Thiotrichaceae bacterium]|nr:succinate dehydrogenase assembly factor 2 [Thiotrichaceae bacterium]